jgi:hypothetical protein
MLGLVNGGIGSIRHMDNGQVVQVGRFEHRKVSLSAAGHTLNGGVELSEIVLVHTTEGYPFTCAVPTS